MQKELVLSAFHKFMEGRGEEAYRILSLGNGMIVAKTQKGLQRFAYNKDFCKPMFQRTEPSLPLYLQGWKVKLGREEAIRGILPFLRWNSTKRISRIMVEAPHIGDPSTMIRVSVNGHSEVWFFTLPDDIKFRNLDEEEEVETFTPDPTPIPEKDIHDEEVPSFDVRIWFKGHSMALCNALMNLINKGLPSDTISWSLLGGPVAPENYGDIEATVFKNSQAMFPDITGIKVSSAGILVSMAHASDDIPPDDDEEEEVI